MPLVTIVTVPVSILFQFLKLINFKSCRWFILEFLFFFQKKRKHLQAKKELVWVSLCLRCFETCRKMFFGRWQ